MIAILRNILVLVGFALFIGGIAAVSIPLASIVGGGMCMAGGLIGMIMAMDRREQGQRGKK